MVLGFPQPSPAMVRMATIPVLETTWQACTSSKPTTMGCSSVFTGVNQKKPTVESGLSTIEDFNNIGATHTVVLKKKWGAGTTIPVKQLQGSPYIWWQGLPRPRFNPGSVQFPEKGITNHSSILAWRIPWTKDPRGLQSMRSQSRTWLSDYAHTLKTA